MSHLWLLLCSVDFFFVKQKTAYGCRFSDWISDVCSSDLVLRRVIVGTYTDGFIHAGNLAYLALIALFPFFILLAAALSLFGGSAGGEAAIDAVFSIMPPTVSRTLAEPIREVMGARTGLLLWLGALVALGAVGSLCETIRDTLPRAYGTHFSRGFFHYRLLSIGITPGAGPLMWFVHCLPVGIVGEEQV